MKQCAIPGCARPIPVGPLCRRCLAALDDLARHRVLFSANDEDRAAAIEEAKTKLSGTKAARVGRLLRVALEADRAFSEELARVYGRKACEMRYRSGHTDTRVLDAVEKKLKADDALLAEMRKP